MLNTDLLCRNLRNVKAGDAMAELMTWMKKQTKRTGVSARSGRLVFWFRVDENNRGICQSLEFAEKYENDDTRDYGTYMVAQNNACWEPGETTRTNSHLEDLAGTFMSLVERGELKVHY